VIKDAGDDPDVTHGAEIRVRVRLVPGEGVVFRRGPGVGLVTRPGLELPPGEPAINPVPRRMIREALEEAFREAGLPPFTGRAVEVTVSCPDGEERARKTLNPRLGILGGISILGTRGIVIPYSTSAFRASVELAIKVALAQGHRRLCFTTGGRSEALAREHLPLPEECFVQIGEFLGFALRRAAALGAEEAILAGFPGKVAKAARGQRNLHVRAGAVDLDFLARLAEKAGLEEKAGRIRLAHTAREVAELLSPGEGSIFFRVLAERAAREMEKMAGGRLRTSCLIFGFDGRLLGSGEGGAAGA
jgi:cobalt-precorrin-5B (C1)-methyltransferase